MVNNMNKIIDLVSNPNTDFKAIAIRLAKEYPDVFLEVSGINASSMPIWKREVAWMIDQKLMVPAIKHMRENTGWGLKESKDTVDYVRHYTDPEFVYGTLNSDIQQHQMELGEELIRVIKANSDILGYRPPQPR